MDEELNRAEESELEGPDRQGGGSAEDRDSAGDMELLQEIRENYEYANQYWEAARKERAIDMRYLASDPWEKADKQEREDTHRPAINHDELNQYVFQFVNNLRQNKRGIKVEPRGNGASDKTAELRQDIVRTVEYRSKAQSAYLRAGQDMAEGSYGFFRVARKYVLSNPAPDDPRAWDQEISIRTIPNPDSVLYDPDCKEPDWCDASFCFVLEPMSTEAFKRRWPRARKTDFTAQDMQVAKNWITDKTVLVAEYWKVKVTETVIRKGGRKRRGENKVVLQYMTNGVEILDEEEQLGEEIPIPVMVGLERYREAEGVGVKRELISLPRFARDPQMSLAYLCSQEMEEAGMSPKTPVIGYTGQFVTDLAAWKTANKVPHAFLQVDPVADPLNPTQVLGLPQWQQFTPNFQEYEIAKDSCRRAIQAAMGISPLPTAAQRNNEKSGIALEQIADSEAVGSYHFVEGYERGVERGGRIVDSWIKQIYDSEDREMGLHQADDKRRVVRLNTAEPYVDEKTGKTEQHVIGDEEHDVTISTGPSMRSQRDAVDHFLDSLIQNLKNLPVAPAAAAKLLALAIQMKDLGPQGDQMAEIISPSDTDSSQQLQGMQQQAQQQAVLLQQMQAQLQQLQLEKQGRVVDNEYRIQLEKLKIEATAAAAEINTKAQNLEERMKFVEDLWAQLHGQAHDAGMQAQEQAHEQGMAQQQQEAAAAAAAQAPGQGQPPGPASAQQGPTPPYIKL